MKVGYSFWGFLSDIKMNENFERISTPDGNAFYSWSIIKELQDQLDEVIQIMPDRDRFSVQKLKEKAFKAWATEDRFYCYKKSKKIDYNIDLNSCDKNEVFRLWDENHLDDSDCILHEWRMEISNRNEMSYRGKPGWQPDLFLQNCLIEYCFERKIKLIVFDLDYKLNEEDYDERFTVFELGDKWASKSNTEKVYIPFCFEHINDFSIKKKFENDLVYVGNRYERDWCIDKYIPEDMKKCIVYGNWKESGRDSEQRWPLINFGNRLQTEEMYSAYSNSVCTILLAKEEYCRYSFMTARIIESVFYGSIPLFIEEYGEETIEEFAGKYAKLLTVRSKKDVVNCCNFFKVNRGIREYVINYLRNRLRKMDSKYFVEKLKEVCK